MDKGLVRIIYGEGKGKTTSAIGQAIQAACQGKTVVIIQFLKKKYEDETGFLKRLEPEIKEFRFEKSERSFNELSEQEQIEERQNLQNGLNFARKVLVTEECDVLILDEVLGLLENGVSTAEELKALLQAKHGSTEVILTGIYDGKEVWDAADEVTEMIAKNNR